jgi:hypothetical protein
MDFLLGPQRPEVALPQRARSAPRKARDDSCGGPVPGSAHAATLVAARAAACRNVHPSGAARTHPKSAPRFAAKAQRRRASQHAALPAPTARHGLTRARTAAAVSRSNPQSAKAHAIAAKEYSRRASISAGTTVCVAQQAVQR